MQDRTLTAPVIEAQPSGDPEGPSESPAVNVESRSTDKKDSSQERLTKDKDASDLAAEEEEESYGFAHPAASRPQRAVWIPRDALGLWKEEERECEEAGVRVSESHAVMDEKGKVDVSGGPPDMVQ